MTRTECIQAMYAYQKVVMRDPPSTSPEHTGSIVAICAERGIGVAWDGYEERICYMLPEQLVLSTDKFEKLSSVPGPSIGRSRRRMKI
jgi:hypothetical protein